MGVIRLHRLSARAEVFYLNPDLIVAIDSTPDTVVTLTTHQKVWSLTRRTSSSAPSRAGARRSSPAPCLRPRSSPAAIQPSRWSPRPPPPPPPSLTTRSKTDEGLFA